MLESISKIFFDRLKFLAVCFASKDIFINSRSIKFMIISLVDNSKKCGVIKTFFSTYLSRSFFNRRRFFFLSLYMWAELKFFPIKISHFTLSRNSGYNFIRLVFIIYSFIYIYFYGFLLYLFPPPMITLSFAFLGDSNIYAAEALKKKKMRREAEKISQ